MKYKNLTLVAIFILFSFFGRAQSRYPADLYDYRLTSLGNLWFYVERIDRALDSARNTIDSLRHELANERKLRQFNTEMDNYLRQHGVGVYPAYKPKDTMALGPFYIY